MNSRRPFLLLRISFPGRPIFIQFVPVVVVRRARPVGLLVVGVHAGLVGRLQRVEAVGVLARVLPIGARQTGKSGSGELSSEYCQNKG